MSIGSAGKKVLCWLLLAVFMTPTGGMPQGSSSSTRFTPEELDQMLALVALYTDSLLAQILMASTYPIEVVEAEQWVKRYKNLKGAQLVAAIERCHWDPSVQALIPFPQVLAMMSQKMDWTQRVGDALLSQQDEVMDTIQRLRSLAFVQGNLKSCREQRVVVEQEVIRVEPANPELIYVPIYNSTVVYGGWWYPSYPPYSFSSARPAVTTGLLTFAAGVAVGSTWNSAWGSWNWGGHQINTSINRNLNLKQNNGRIDLNQTSRWQHEAKHRKGNPYRSKDLRERYGQAQPGDSARRENFRGFEQHRGAGPNLGVTVPARGLSGGSAGARRQTSERGGDLTQPGLLEFEECGPTNIFRSMGPGDDVERFSDRGRRSRQQSRGSNAGGDPFRRQKT